MSSKQALTIACSEDLRKNLTPALDSLGYKNRVISDSLGNVSDVINVAQPEIVFIDSRLQQATALSLSREIRARFKIPTILLLFPDQLGDSNLLDTLKPDACLAHPFEISQLQATIYMVNSKSRIESSKTEINLEGYQAIFETSSAGIWCFEIPHPIAIDVDDDTFIQQTFDGSVMVECNDGMAQMYGYEKGEDLIGAPLEALLDPSDQGNVDYLLAFKNNGFRLFNAESRELDRHGQVKVFINNLMGIIENGRIVRAWGSQIDITDRKQNEELQLAIYQISEASHSAETLELLYKRIHEILQTLMPAKNMYIALYDQEKDEVEFSYYHDENTKKPSPRKGGKGLTEYIIRTDQTFLASENDIEKLVDQKEIERTGYPAYNWLGVPLKSQGSVVGVLAVQNYDEGVRYSQREKDIITFVSHQIATAISRKRTQRELSLLSHAMEYTTDDLLIADAEGMVKYVNHAFEKLTGLNREELIGQDIRSLSLNKYEREFYRNMISSLDKGNPFHGEIAKQDKNGNSYFHEQVVTPVKNELDKITNYISLGRNITKRKQIEEELRRSQERLQIILSQIPAVFWTTDTDLVFTYSTGAAISMMDNTAQNSQNLSIYEYFQTSDENYLPIQKHRTALSGKSVQYEMEWGGRIFESLVEPLRDENDRIIGCIGISLDITERKDAEKKFAQERNLLELLMESVPDTIYFKDNQSRFIKINEAQARVLGAESPEAAVGKTDFDFFAKDFATEAYQDEQKIFQSKTPLISKPEKVVDKDGESTWFSVTKIPIIQSDGAVDGLVGISRDITALKQSEDLQSALYTISEATHSSGSLNDIFAKIHQTIQHLMPAENFYICLHDTSVDLLTFPYFVDAKDSAPDPYVPRNGLTEYVLRESTPLLLSEQSLKDMADREQIDLKGTLPVDWLGVPLLAEGKVMGVLAVQSYTEGIRYSLKDKEILSFVSDQVALTIARKKTESDLANERERLAVTLRSITDGVITTDVNGNVTMINQMAENLTGVSYKEASGKPIDQVYRIIDEQSGEPLKTPIDKMLESEKLSSIPREIILVGKQDRKFIIADSIAPLRDDSSKNIGTVIVFRDLSEQREMEKEVLKSRKLESVGVLAGGIAHDFNNILSSILGNISLAKLTKNSPEKIEELLNNAEEGTTRAAKLTKQLLTFSKGGAPVKEEAAIGELVQNSVQFALRGSNVRPKIIQEKDVWSANVDTGQIDQVMQNLIINADQAMPEGGTIVVRIGNRIINSQTEVTGLEPGKYIVIQVTDQGGGISEENLAKIFDPYFTTKSTGSGLGLATSYAIVQKHGGTIAAHSKIEHGTTMTVFLPAGGDPFTMNNKKSESEELVPGSRHGGSILLLDDDPSVHKTAKAMLEELGYSVAHAMDGEEVINCYRDSMKKGTPFDAVILDLTIPGGMSGKEAAETLTREFPEVRTIVSSGYSTDPVMAEFEKYGFLGKVEKPYNLTQLAETVQIVLGKA